ncbi:AarF/UbiB family protein [Aestuariimicrobium sp. Y1814]|uniref:AarF/UbiB family protein n=1 Tax=Aestuariimicrobium sp. Y1814 TaxID=3418742 RepID=UPI003DA70195
MSITEVVFCLPDDVHAVPDPTGAEVLVARRGSRLPPQVLSDDAWALLQRFRTPATLTAAIIDHCREFDRDPVTTLDEAFAVLVALTQHDLLVPEAEAAALVARLTPHRTIGQATLTAPIRVLRDSELWWARLPGGGTAVVKVVDEPTVGPDLFTREVTALQRLAGGPVPDLLWHQPSGTGGTMLLSCAEGDPIDLAALDERGHRPPHTAISLVLAMLDAYTEVHARGVLHGDVHPGNVLATPAGRIHLLDFGLAAITDCDLGPPARTAGGEHLDPQMAAALLANPDTTPDSSHLPDLDLPAEVYTIAALGFRVLTGHPHLDLAVERHQALTLITTAPPRPFTELGRPAWPAVERVLARALAHNTDRRTGSVARLREELSQAALQ